MTAQVVGAEMQIEAGSKLAPHTGTGVEVMLRCCRHRQTLSDVLATICYGVDLE